VARWDGLVELVLVESKGCHPWYVGEEVRGDGGTGLRGEVNKGPADRRRGGVGHNSRRKGLPAFAALSGAGEAGGFGGDFGVRLGGGGGGTCQFFSLVS
jgi:hypothetical protein